MKATVEWDIKVENILGKKRTWSWRKWELKFSTFSSKNAAACKIWSQQFYIHLLSNFVYNELKETFFVNQLENSELLYQCNFQGGNSSMTF